MRALVTGAAGFIGSTLSERLLAEGHDVVGVDLFNDYYDPAVKRSNIATAATNGSFTLVEGDLNELDLAAHLDGVDVVWHLAGQPGVRLPASEFPRYVAANISATAKVIDAVEATGRARLVYASSSSVYGNAERYPTIEDALPAPRSRYGVTKLAAEHLVTMAGAGGIETVSLRYFTVYGPRQRPDMAIHRLCEAALDDRPFPLNGDGSAVRSFTYVDDVVDATFRAGITPGVERGAVFNVAGGSETSVAELIELIEGLVGRPLALDRRPADPTEAVRTGGSTDAITAALGWTPAVGVAEGVANQMAWHRARRSDA